MLSASLVAASEGDPAVFPPLCQRYPTGAWAGLPVGCQDWEEQKSFSELQAAQHALGTLSPITLGYKQSLGYFARCISWPAKATNAQRRLKSSIANTATVLMVNSHWDPSTSIQWAASMRREIPYAHSVFRNGSGHTSYNTPGETAEAMNGVHA